MKTEDMQRKNMIGHGFLKAMVLVLFIVAAIVAVRFTSIKDVLTPAQVNALLQTTGLWAPVVFILCYAAGVCLFVPGTLLTAIGAAVFGPYRGFVYVWLGAMLGAAAAFLIGR